MLTTDTHQPTELDATAGPPAGSRLVFTSWFRDDAVRVAADHAPAVVRREGPRWEVWQLGAGDDLRAELEALMADFRWRFPTDADAAAWRQRYEALLDRLTGVRR
jgi:hypothetical protein